MFSILPNIDPAITAIFFASVICAFIFISTVILAVVGMVKWPKLAKYFVFIAIVFGCLGASFGFVLNIVPANVSISSISMPCDQIPTLKDIKMDAKKFLGIPCDSLIVLKIQRHNIYGHELTVKYDVESIAELMHKK